MPDWAKYLPELLYKKVVGRHNRYFPIIEPVLHRDYGCDIALS